MLPLESLSERKRLNLMLVAGAILIGLFGFSELRSVVNSAVRIEKAPGSPVAFINGEILKKDRRFLSSLKLPAVVEIAGKINSESGLLIGNKERALLFNYIEIHPSLPPLLALYAEFEGQPMMDSLPKLNGDVTLLATLYRVPEETASESFDHSIKYMFNQFSEKGVKVEPSYWLRVAAPGDSPIQIESQETSWFGYFLLIVSALFFVAPFILSLLRPEPAPKFQKFKSI